MVLSLGRLARKNKQRSTAQSSLDTQVPLTDDQVRAAWTAASWLIDYPDDELLERLPILERLIAGLPDRPREGLQTLITSLGTDDIIEVRSTYVETFDTRRRGCLYLTYFSNGDTRRRGMALLKIKEQYRNAGLEVSDDELPDHLTYVLEFGAGHDLAEAADILKTNRAGLELLRLHLDDQESVWHGAIDAVCATLPALKGPDIEAVQKLAAEGPEDEQVGLGGYGDGSEDMPPMDMTPYATSPPPQSGGGKTFIPLASLKGRSS